MGIMLLILVLAGVVWARRQRHLQYNSKLHATETCGVESRVGGEHVSKAHRMSHVASNKYSDHSDATTESNV